MKKIKAPHDNKSRIVCVTTQGKHDFYYQPSGTKARYWVADCPFSGSIFDYFRSKGRNMNDHGFSLTLGQLYRFRDYENVKLSRLMNKLPGQIDYVIRYCIPGEQIAEQYPRAYIPVHICSDSYEYELAA